MSEGTASPCEAFNTWFSVDFASSAELCKRVYEVRYRVYCEEFGYEEREAFPDGQERDKYDAASLHCLITHRPTGRPAGCVRLVPANAGAGLDIDLSAFALFAEARVNWIMLEEGTSTYVPIVTAGITF